jgi:hypothetical protein
MYQIVYHCDSHCHSSIIGGNDMFYMMHDGRACRTYQEAMLIPFELPTAVESKFSPGLA